MSTKPPLPPWHVSNKDVCKLCRGDGSLLAANVMEFWDCPACGGCGASVQYGPRTIGPGARKL